MKLIYRIISRLSIAMLVLMTVWAALFYYIMVDEINDETDDSLDSYSEYLIIQSLAGKELPTAENGTNNSYHIREVTAEYAAMAPRMEYLNQEIYIESMRETETARMRRTVFANSVGRHYELTVMIPAVEQADLKETIMWWSVILYIVLLLTVITLNAWIIYRNFRPLYALLGWLNDLKLGGDIPPLKSDTKATEFRRLNEAIMRSALRNNEMYEQQSSFIGNASHEMQTPIAISLNHLELLACDSSLSEEQLGEVLKVRRTLEQLSQLNRTLLLLTRIENGQITESSQVDVNAMVKGLVENYSEVYASRRIAVEIMEDAPLSLVMNNSLASALLGNLIKNALIYSPEGGTVQVRFSPQTLSISNTAAEGALDSELIFRRFWQGGNKAGAAGLGLSLCESICRLYGMRIVYDFHNGMHRFLLHTA
jgi:signal transduction histidine kinase